MMTKKKLRAELERVREQRDRRTRDLQQARTDLISERNAGHRADAATRAADEEHVEEHLESLKVRLVGVMSLEVNLRNAVETAGKQRLAIEREVADLRPDPEDYQDAGDLTYEVALRRWSAVNQVLTDHRASLFNRHFAQGGGRPGGILGRSATSDAVDAMQQAMRHTAAFMTRPVFPPGDAS